MDSIPKLLVELKLVPAALLGAGMVAAAELPKAADPDAIASVAAGRIPSDPAKEWWTYGHDAGAMRFSPLKKITPGNVRRLKGCLGLCPRAQAQAHGRQAGRTAALHHPRRAAVAIPYASGRVHGQQYARTSGSKRDDLSAQGLQEPGDHRWDDAGEPAARSRRPGRNTTTPGLARASTSGISR